MYEAKRSKFDQLTCQTRKINKLSRTSLRKKNSRSCMTRWTVNMPFSTKYNALYDLEDTALVLLHMCKTG